MYRPEGPVVDGKKVSHTIDVPGIACTPSTLKEEPQVRFSAPPSGVMAKISLSPAWK